MERYKKEIIWILIPLIYGYLSNVFVIVIPFLNQIVFGVFWFWVGIKYATLHGSKLKNFLIGNSIWLLSFLIYIWQFVILNDESRNMFFAGISQYYMQSFLWSGIRLSSLFSNVLHGTIITILSYLIMLFIFLFGFFKEKFRTKQFSDHGIER